MTRTRASASLDTEVVSRLRLAIMRLARRLRQQAEPGATPSMLSALSVIERLGPLTLGELADIERIQPPTVTKIVARLEEDGLVARDTDLQDRRVARVTLTKDGKRFIQSARTRKDAYLARRLRDLDEADRRTLSDAARIMEKILEDGE